MKANEINPYLHFHLTTTEGELARIYDHFVSFEKNAIFQGQTMVTYMSPRKYFGATFISCNVLLQVTFFLLSWWVRTLTETGKRN